MPDARHSPCDIGIEAVNGDSESRMSRRAPSPVRNPTTRRKLIAFGWYGGKFSHLDWLLPLLPECHHYCEPFAGSGAVLLNRPPSPVETYNDLDGEVANFFRVLRDAKAELTEKHWLKLKPVTVCRPIYILQSKRMSRR